MEKKNLNNLTILYVEDDSMIRKLTTKSLELFEANVIQASDGQEGIELYDKYEDNIDLILTDIKMPRKDGMQMSQIIRQKDQDIPIIITTAHEETAFLKTAIELKVNAYVLKPIDIYQLYESIQKEIEPKILKKKLIQKNHKLQIEIEKNREKHQIMIAQSRFASMGELINMIAHQWRQPLASIGTAAFNLQYKLDTNSYPLNTIKDQKKHKEFFSKKLKEIELYIQNMTLTIDDFKNFYKTDKLLSKKNLQELVEDSIKILSSIFKEKNILINKDFNSTKQLNIYPNEIVHVIINILNNSQDNFTEKDINTMKIDIKTFDLEDYSIIEISDNGGGIPEHISEKIFDPYFSTKKEKNGTGLGLYMSKLIIEKHHKGKLESWNTLGGVCFSIKIPIR